MDQIENTRALFDNCDIKVNSKISLRQFTENDIPQAIAYYTADDIFEINYGVPKEKFHIFLNCILGDTQQIALKIISENNLIGLVGR